MTTDDLRLRAIDGPTHRVVGVALLALCPAAVLLAGLTAPARGPAPFAVAVAAHALAVGFLLWLLASWLAPRRRPGRGDVVLAVAPLPAAAASLLLVLAVAEAQGIRGSAMPRVRQGRPFDADVAYLAAVGAVLATATAAVLLLAALLLARRVARTDAPSDR